ncbi:tRNA lysidine(34) synthetase TilS [Roseovarius ramblicola]|uniref:tRNA(Ile)-lysidine synthase n=1 Tax=Roseovarius ramblicola TaxID=2022336 RepID=A0ABV5I2H9_9RHOB
MSGAEEALRAHFGAGPPDAMGVAVSGGSDSLALLHLMRDWQDEGGPALRVATVDHGLRTEAGAEAAQVARLCAGLGVAHDTLRWDGQAARGNLPDAARRARYRLLAGWARRHGLRDVAIGHTADDVAETFLMRLARGSGLDGLAAMRDRWRDGGVTFHRPVLTLGRDGLRDHLRARGVAWADDPTNDDTTYTRTRARVALAALAPLGLGADTLAATAARLRAARTALGTCARRVAEEIAHVDGGDLLWRRDDFDALPDEIARRLLVAGVAWMTGRDYPPRGTAMAAFLGAARAGRRMTLQGCVLSAVRGHLRLSREYRAVAGLRAPSGAVWDGRWRATGGTGRATVAALGPAGLRACPGWRAGGLPHGPALASPGVWRGGTLIAAPLAGWENGWRLELLRGLDDYLDRLLA